MARRGQMLFLLRVTSVVLMTALFMMAPSFVIAEEEAAPVCGEKTADVENKEMCVEAEESEAPAESGCEDWHFLFYTPGWVPGMNGDVTARGITAPIDISIWDAFENLKYLESLAVGHFEAKKGRWGFLLEFIYFKLGQDVNAARDIDIPIVDPPATIPVTGKIDIVSKMSWDEAAGFYEVYRSASCKGIQPTVMVEALAGARYTYLETELDARFTGPLGNTIHLEEKGDRDWVDPFVGGRVFWNLTDRCMLGFRGDIGGFGLASDITVNLDALGRYRITNWLNAYAGFRALYQDYETGSGSDKFKWDVWSYGPWMGIGVEF